MSTEKDRAAVDKFVTTAYNNPELMKFIKVAVGVLEEKSTMRLTLHVKDGMPLKGEGNFTF